MTKIFIGGSRHIKELKPFFRERLNTIILKEFTILIGDADGADKIIQKYINENNYNKVIVYCTGDNCRNNINNWSNKNVIPEKKVSGRKFYMLKDLEMAKDCDYGLMLWDHKSPGTINNIINLLRYNKICVIYLNLLNKYFNVNSIETLSTLLSECKPLELESINKKIALYKQIEELKHISPTQMEFSV